MVYRGKPSPGCEPCRKRRAKCDGKKPGCGQCTRKSIRCHYRDLSNLYFQDQTSDVLRKQQHRGQDSPVSSSGRSSPQTVPSPGEVLLTWQNSDAATLSPNGASDAFSFNIRRASTSPGPLSPPISLKEYALGFFMNIYVPTSPFDYLAQHYDLRALFETTPSPNGKPLPAAIQAAAYASLSLDQSHSVISTIARKYYTIALNLTNRALASSEPAQLDSVLISVLLLGLFESILFRGRDSPVSWTAHAGGALALLRMGGAKQFNTPLGRALFVHSSATITSSYLRRGEVVPPAMRELYAYAPADMESHPAIGLGRMMGRLAELRVAAAGITEATVAREGGVEALLDMLRDAAALERNFDAYGSSTPAEWWSVVPPADAPPHAFRRTAHTYVAHMAARMWISMRLARLALNERVYTACRRLVAYHEALGSQLLPPEIATEMSDMRDEALARGRAMIVDSLAVVPYFWDPASRKPARAFAARLLIWPLSIAAQSELCEPDAREYAIATLKAIGGEEGGSSSFPQALEAVSMLEEGRVAEDWLHLWHLS